MNESEPIFGHNGMIHDGHENIPDYSFNPDTVSVKDGNWFDPSVWSDGIPDPDSKVRIAHSVRIKIEGSEGDLNGDGKVDLADYDYWKKSTDRKEADLLRWIDDFLGLSPVYQGSAICQSCMVEPSGVFTIHEGCQLEVVTLQIQGKLMDYKSKVVFKDAPIDYDFDPGQWGHSLIALSDSVWSSYGSTFVSENPNGTRGHIAAIHTAYIKVKKITCHDLGRTTIEQLDNTQYNADGSAKYIGKNQMARYAFHLHHLCGPKGLPEDEPQWLVEDANIYGSRKWGFVIHSSHHGLGRNIIVDGADGAGISFEAGNEYKNTLIDCHATNVKGTGLGPQGRNQGLPIQNIGTGKALDPFRTIGDHGHEGGAIWGRGISNNIINCTVSNAEYGFSFWSRFHPKDQVKIPSFKGANPMDGEFIIVPAGQQLGCKFEGNKIDNCKFAANIQGLTGHVLINSLEVTNTIYGIDSSYNETLALENSHLKGTGVGWPMQHGFTSYWRLINNIVTGWKGSFQLWDDFYIQDGEYDSIQIQYKHTPLRPRILSMNGVKVDHLSYTLGDYNKNRSYNMQQDLFIYNHQGVIGDDFQLWMLEQDPTFIPLKQPNPARITPENGLNNQQLLDKYAVCLAGKITPPTATTRPGIVGKVTPLPKDNVGSTPINFSFSTSKDSITCVFKTVVPCRIHAEHNIGDIKLGEYSPILLPIPPEFKTDHTITFKGLKPNTNYNYVLQTVDEQGNQGGDVRSTSSLNFVPRRAKTLA